MRELTADDMRQLTTDQLARLHRSLTNFTREKLGSHVQAVGFGPKFTSGRRDPQVPWSARFLVRHKLVPLKQRHHIPAELTLRLKMPDGTFSQAKFVTDVQATGGDFVPTAAPLEAPYGVVAGIALRWTGADSSGRRFGARWGLITVGHAFHGMTLPQPVRVRRLSTTAPVTWLQGTAIAATRMRHTFDAAVVQCEAADLRLSGMLPQPDVQLWTKDEATLLEDVRLGVSTTSVRVVELGSVPLRLQTYLHQQSFAGLGTLVHVLQAEGKAGDFAPGTSGTVWTVEGVPVGIQVGAYRPEFRVGIAQALFAITGAWCPGALGTRDNAVVHAF